MEGLVVPLKKALYGHPDAGGYWEQRCTRLVLQCGFEQIEGWPSVFWHEQSRALLTIYGDDFKMAGPSSELPAI